MEISRPAWNQGPGRAAGRAGQRNLQARLEPGLIRQGRRRLLDLDQSEQQGGYAEQHRSQLAVAVPVQARDDDAAHAEPKEGNHADVHRDDEQD